MTGRVLAEKIKEYPIYASLLGEIRPPRGL
jgi:hypothetical protein